MHTLETKSASAADTDVNAAFGEFMRAFEAFKETNDDRLSPARAPLVGRSRHHRQARPHRPRARRHQAHRRRPRTEIRAASPRRLSRPRAGANLQHKAAFDAYVRKGDATTLRDLEAKALSVGTDADGGYLVPDELERAVNRGVRNVSPIRAIAGIRQVSSLGLQEAVRHHRRGSRLDRGNRRAPRDRHADARRALLPHQGALRHAGGHLRAAG